MCMDDATPHRKTIWQLFYEITTVKQRSINSYFPCLLFSIAICVTVKFSYFSIICRHFKISMTREDYARE
jgi:hypothetical protein